eukprot:1014725-Pelagomonas_calceolata.AAC.3
MTTTHTKQGHEKRSGVRPGGCMPYAGYVLGVCVCKSVVLTQARTLHRLSREVDICLTWLDGISSLLAAAGRMPSDIHLLISVPYIIYLP